MTTTFKTGDIVCHRARFLKNTGYYNPPINGKVVDVGPSFILVQWCDRKEPSNVHQDNIIRYDEKHLEPR